MLGKAAPADLDALRRCTALVQRIGFDRRSNFGRGVRGELPELSSRPEDLPAVPTTPMLGTWLDELGRFLRDRLTSRRNCISFLPFDEAREIVRPLGIKSPNEW